MYCVNHKEISLCYICPFHCKKDKQTNKKIYKRYPALSCRGNMASLHDKDWVIVSPSDWEGQCVISAKWDRETIKSTTKTTSPKFMSGVWGDI